MRLPSVLLSWTLALAALAAAQMQTSSPVASSTARATPSGSSSSTARPSSLSPSAASSLSSVLSVSSASLRANATSSSSAALASPSVLANGTTLYPNATLGFPNGTTLYPNGTLASNETASSILPYDIKLDGAYGVLGGVLIVTGAPVCVLGGKNRWTSLFLLYFYAGACVALVLAVHFGVAVPENPPSATMRGIFVLIGAVTGGLAGAVAVLFGKWARHGMPAIAGFAIGWWILAFKQGGSIDVLWGRWVLLIGLMTIAFVAGLHPRVHNPIVVLSTAFVGATALVLGIDCFTRAGLKELYVWNLGFRSIFDTVLKSHSGQFRVGDIGIVEIALIGIFWLIGAAVQFKAYEHLRKPLPSMSRSARQERREMRALDAERRVTRHDDELAAWEGTHGRGARGGTGGRGWMDRDVGASDPALKRKDSGWGSTSGSAAGPDVVGVPILTHQRNDSDQTAIDADRRELQQKEALLDEIQTIRRSIEILRSSTPATPVDHLGLGSSSTLLPAANNTSPVAYRPLSTAGDFDVPGGFSSSARSPRTSASPAPATEWDRYVERRQIIRTPSKPACAAEELDDAPPARTRRGSTLSVHGLMDPPPAQRRSSMMDPPSALFPAPPAASSSGRPSHTRELSKDQLADRHSQLMRKMQSPAMEAFAAERAREEWDARRRSERDEQAHRRPSAQAATVGSRRKSNVDVEGWRGSVVLDENRVRPPMGGPPTRGGSFGTGQQAR